MLSALSQGPFLGASEPVEHRRGSVASALLQHAQHADTIPKGSREAALAAQDVSLRSSIARLETLTKSTKAVLEARQQQEGTEGVAEEEEGTGGGSEAVGEGSGLDEDESVDAKSEGGGVEERVEVKAQQSKYLQVIRARAEARQQLPDGGGG